jgi:hypothetical protein
MPKRRLPASRVDTPPSSRGNFRNRYDDLETRRDQLVSRLRRLGDIAKSHPGYKRALKLLNDTFRKSRLPQRLAVLQAAAWLIDLLEQFATIV